MQSRNLSAVFEEQVQKIVGDSLKHYISMPENERQKNEEQGLNLSKFISSNLMEFVKYARIGSVLIVAEEGIGNMVLLTPAIRNLKAAYPLIKITVLCKPLSGQVIDGWECVDKVIHELDNEIYDLGYFTIWSGKTLQQYGSRLQQQCRATLVTPLRKHHESVQNMTVCDFLNCSMELSPTHCQKAVGEDWGDLCATMELLGLLDNPYIVFGDTALRLPNGEWDVKRWPYYTTLAELIRRKFPEYKIVLIGDEQDKKEAQQKSWPNNVIFDFMGTINIPQLASLLESAKMYIGNDTGPTHIAAAMGTKTYAIFGPTLPGKNYPLGEKVTVLNPRTSCCACQYTERFETCDSLEHYSAEEVYQDIFFPKNEKKRILLVGDFSTGNALRNEVYIKRNLEKNFKVKVYQYYWRNILNKYNNDIYEASYDLLNNIIFYEPELVLICGGHEIHPGILNLAGSILKNTKTAIWYVDNRGKVEHWFKNLSSIVDQSYWSTGDPKLLSQVFSKLQAPCQFLPIVPDDASYYPEEVEKDIDVLFVGTPHSKERIDMLEYLVANLPKEINFQIYGNGSWPDTLKHKINKGVFDKDFNTLLNRSKIVINQNIINNVPLYFSDRYFYPMATKTVGLNKYVPNLEDWFIDFEDMVFWNTHEELVEKIKMLLKDSILRNHIAEMGYKKYKQNYTLTTIMQKLLDSSGVKYESK